MKDCSKCKSWSDCRGKEWYSPDEIRYCRYQCIWLIENMIDYDRGEFVVVVDEWPAEIESTPNSSSSYHAPFELIRQITGDVTSRLKKTGKDGMLLVVEIQKGYDYYSSPAEDALRYISGWSTKLTDYRQWLCMKNVRKNLTSKTEKH